MTRVGLEPPTSGSGIGVINHQATVPLHLIKILHFLISGLSKKAATKQVEEIACQAKDKIDEVINVDITIKKRLFVMENEEVQEILKNTRTK